MEPNRSPSTPDSSVLYCAQCGSEAKSSQLFCAACGAPLAATIESPPLTQKPASNEPFSSMAPPLPDFRFEAQPDPDFPYTITPVFLSEEEAFVRQKPRYYSRVFGMIRAGRSTPWNWGAFLGNFSWFFLRKMYARGAALGAALFAPFLLSSFAFFYTLVNLQSGKNTESAFFILVGLFFFIPLCWLVLLVACGLRANKWYYDYTQKHLNTAQSLPLEQKRQYFNKYGGVNVPLYYMGPFVIGMLVMGLFLLAFFISISPFLSQPGGIQI